MTGLTIWIPEKYRRPKYFCRVCAVTTDEPAVFYDGEEAAYQRHVAECSGRHEGVLRERSPRQRLPSVYDPEFEGSDVEWGRWLREHAPEIRRNPKKMKTGLDGL